MSPLLEFRAELAIRNHKYDDANRYMREAVEVDAEMFGRSTLRFMQTERQWANCLAAAGSLDEAQKMFEKQLKEFPDDSKHDAEYARLLADCAACKLAGKSADDAESLSKSALGIFAELDKPSLVPDHQYEMAARNYAKVLIQKGKDQEAIDQFQRAISLQGRDCQFDRRTMAETYYMIGLGYATQGQPDKAVQAFDNSIRCYREIYGADAPCLAPLLQLRDKVAQMASSPNADPDDMRVR